MYMINIYHIIQYIYIIYNSYTYCHTWPNVFVFLVFLDLHMIWHTLNTVDTMSIHLHILLMQAPFVTLLKGDQTMQMYGNFEGFSLS